MITKIRSKNNLALITKIFSLAFLLSLAQYAIASDFCESKNLNVIEQNICSSPSLFWSDRELNALYHLARIIKPSNGAHMAAEQKQWLADVRNHCADVQCLAKVYLSRNTELKRYVNSISEPIPTPSEWHVVFPGLGNARNDCNDYLTVDFSRTRSGQIAGAWEGTTFGCAHINGGMIDVKKDGNIFDIRILGGDPSYQAGVAFLARNNDRLYVAMLFTRSSTGMAGDYESFDNIALNAKPSAIPSANDGMEITDEELAQAWKETEKSAVDNKICQPGQPIDVCIRRKHS